MINASQMRAARALIDWSQGDLAEKTGLALATIKRMEKIGPGRSSADNVQAVKSALESGGVMFIEQNGNGPGVRLRDRSS
ncbi:MULTISPECIES: helix-turn-helix domain-containing protein [unclassified Mesorhizobium]|uniref:helix-turn-helix domain-containing protein n=1 Tax=unclassified Mesorhizobium TaxID=325217 RepID=UPI00301519DE